MKDVSSLAETRTHRNEVLVPNIIEKKLLSARAPHQQAAANLVSAAQGGLSTLLGAGVALRKKVDEELQKLPQVHLQLLKHENSGLQRASKTPAMEGGTSRGPAGSMGSELFLGQEDICLAHACFASMSFGQQGGGGKGQRGAPPPLAWLGLGKSTEEKKQEVARHRIEEERRHRREDEQRGREAGQRTGQQLLAAENSAEVTAKDAAHKTSQTAMAAENTGEVLAKKVVRGAMAAENTAEDLAKKAMRGAKAAENSMEVGAEKAGRAAMAVGNSIEAAGKEVAGRVGGALQSGKEGAQEAARKGGSLAQQGKAAAGRAGEEVSSEGAWAKEKSANAAGEAGEWARQGAGRGREGVEADAKLERAAEKGVRVAQQLRVPVKYLAVKQFLSGALAGGIGGSLAAPLDMIRTRAMAGEGGSSVKEVVNTVVKKEGSSSPVLKINFKALRCPHCFPRLDSRAAQGDLYKGFGAAFRKIVREEGVGALYRGVWPPLVAVVPSSAINFYTYETLKRKWQEKHGTDKEPAPFLPLLLGAASGAVSTAATYPLEAARKHLSMSAVPGKASEKLYAGVGEAMNAVLKEQGFQGLYRGLPAQLLAVVPATAVGFLVYETAKRALVADKEERRDEVKE
eukprot:jgi/Mesen1/6491/ME000331S05604